MDWLPVNLPFKEVKKRGMLKVGVVLEMADGTRNLVGDINVLGGTCDDCPVDAGMIVKAYAIIDTRLLRHDE